jgi:hypothetical protein
MCSQLADHKVSKVMLKKKKKKKKKKSLMLLLNCRRHLRN